MDNKVKKLVLDIYEAICSIEDYIGDQRDFTIYQSNKMMRRAVEREFEIIGEAMNRLNKIDHEIPIKSKKQIIGMRNRVIHGYDSIDDEILWGTIIKHLPTLKKETKEILNS